MKHRIVVVGVVAIVVAAAFLLGAATNGQASSKANAYHLVPGDIVYIDAPMKWDCVYVSTPRQLACSAVHSATHRYAALVSLTPSNVIVTLGRSLTKFPKYK